MTREASPPSAEMDSGPASSSVAAARERIEAALGHDFARPELLETALRHSSFAYETRAQQPRLSSASSAAEAKARTREAETRPSQSNERLEFLGDSVVGLIVAEALYRAKPDWDEGQLTRAMHALVEGRALAELARSLNLGEALSLGRTERQSGGAEKTSILADAMEAVLGAFYLDAGLAPVASFVERVFADALAADAPVVARDPKTSLQERLMALDGAFPTYRLVRDSEIEGDEERFEVEALRGDTPIASGIGRTKRAAERAAAEAALLRIEV